MKALTIAGFSFSAALIAFAQPPDVSARFDAADIHRSINARNPYTWGSGGILRGLRYDLDKATMLDMIRLAYGVDADHIVGGPSWLAFDRFDIGAKAAVNTPQATVKLMLKNLLADRFKLAVHQDTRPMLAFSLTAGRTKPRLKDSDGMGDPVCNYVQQPTGSTETVYACRNMTMSVFANRLRDMGWDYLTTAVVDNTHLEGTYDFDLRWNGRSQLLRNGSDRTTIFAAVENQLGLSLTPATLPSPVLVIDRVSESPTPNAPDIGKKLPPRPVEFEVADLKVNKSSEQSFLDMTPGAGLEVRNIGLRLLLGAGWDMDWDQTDKGFANIPKWVDGVKLDIHAKAPAYPNARPLTGNPDDDVRLMLRNLLTERFQIKTHVENLPREAYSLTAVKPKMKKADPSSRAVCKDSPTIVNDPRDSNPRLARLISCQNVTMAQFAQEIHSFASDYAFYEVEDATGLTGTYDFTLGYTPHYQLNAPGPDGSTDPSGAISLEEAISKQLGLKLETRKRPVPMIVIDHMEEKPLEN